MGKRISVSRSRLLPADYLSRVVVLGDAQNLTDLLLPDLRQILQSQMHWILQNRASRQLEAVLQTGDVVNIGLSELPYGNAYKDFSQLYGALPLMVCAGNHDSGDGARRSARFNAVGSVTGYGMGDLIPLMSGIKDAGHLENSYLLTTFAGRPALILSLEFGPRDATVEWAKGVLDAHPDVMTILLTHAFMDTAGQIYRGDSTQGWDPKGYLVSEPDAWTPAEGLNTGIDLVNKLIEPYSQIKIIVCGHAWSGHAHGTWTRVDGSKYHGFLQDYQNLNGGAVDTRGYLYELTLDFEADVIVGRAFSPLTSPVTEWSETLPIDHPEHNNVYIANAGIR